MASKKTIHYQLAHHSRLIAVIAAMASFVALLGARLVDIQLIRGAEYREQADDNRYFSVRIPPERGVFIDRYGEPLVQNQRRYFQVSDPDATHPQLVPITRDQALMVMATAPAQVQFGVQRQYVYPVALSQVLGYVGPVTADDLLSDSSLAVSDQIGKAALEQRYDQQLRGQASKQVFEVDALGKRQRLVSEEKGRPGQNVATTIDPFISQLAMEALGNMRGAVIVEDGETGEILALVSSPTYNANILSDRFVDPILEQQRQEQVQRYFRDPLQPFFNRGVGGAYPPGSVFKLVTAIAGLEADVIDAATTVSDEGTLKVGEYEYANWYYTQYGRTEGEISLQRAIARSNDIYFYQVAEWLGPNRLAQFARLFGLGKVTGIELGHETAGTIPTPEWKEKVIGEPWYLGNTFHMGIGQGDVLVTPLQITQMTQAIANRGTICAPTLLDQQTHDCRELSLQEEHLDLVLSGMLDVCSSGGTAFPFFPYNQQYRTLGQSSTQTGDNDNEKNPPVLAHTSGSPLSEIKNGAIACKTGTAEFGGVDEQGYRNTHGWLTAIVGTKPITTASSSAVTPSVAASTSSSTTSSTTLSEGAKNYRYQQWLQQVKKFGFPEELVITVIVESDEKNKFREGSYDAGPVVKQIIDGMQGMAAQETKQQLESVSVPVGGAE